MSAASHALDVLVVDDEPLIRWAISRTLAHAGHRVREAVDAVSALRVLRCGGPMPDVVLLDYRLPGAQGFGLLSMIRRLSPASAIVMMSADQQPAAVAEAVALGAHAVMHKPFDMSAVEPMLVAARAGRESAK